MTDSSETKTCGMCRMGIPAGARKCPYCQVSLGQGDSSQRRKSAFLIYTSLEICHENDPIV